MVLSHLLPEKQDITYKHLDKLIFGDYLISDEEAKAYDEVFNPILYITINYFNHSQFNLELLNLISLIHLN